jgi:prepilin-type N-terminal cleavage/methylation domain-containing protein
MRQRGFSLIELLAGLVILTIVITTSLAVIYERERRIRDAQATVLAYQAMANEAEVLRRTPYGQLDGLSGKTFSTDLTILSAMKDPSTGVTVVQANPDVKEIVLNVRWGEKSASMSVLRTDTGGGNLW